MLIQIDGWFGAGKSVLWMLLDGHPDIFCSPIHDYSYCSLIEQSDEHEWVKTRHIEILRKALARTQYYKFEKVYWDGYSSFPFSSKDLIRLPYLLNYYEYEKKFTSHIMSADNWSIQFLIDSLYGKMYESMEYYNDRNKYPTFFASMSNGLYIDSYENIVHLLPGSKSIQVRRSVESIIATRSNRTPMPEDFKTRKFYSDSFNTRIEQGEVEKILAFFDKYNELVKKFPSTYMIIDFRDLVENTEVSMRRIADFLSIDFDPNLLIASYNGREIMHNNRKYIGTEHDDINELLTKQEQAIMKERIEQYYGNIKQ